MADDDKQPMQAMGNKPDGAEDGIGDAPGKATDGGESGGGAYPNPHTGKGKQADVGGGFMGHGGQSDIDYSGTGDGETDKDVGNENAVAK